METAHKMVGRPQKDITGERFGRLEVFRRA